MTTLIPMTQAGYARYLEAAIASFAQDQVAAGRWTAEQAPALSREDFIGLLPQGLASIGLHVFAHSPGAQALYASLGYEVTGINMFKQLNGH